MGILHRPQLATPLVFAPVTYYYGRPQDPFGDAGGSPPAGDDELIEETIGVFDHLTFDDGTNSGFVLIEET